MKSHARSIFTISRCSIISGSANQKRNERSTTESELNGTNDRMSKIVWVKNCVKYQDYPVKLNIIFHNNTSTIKLLDNGKESLGKRTCHFDMRLFHATDLIAAGEVAVKYFPTEKILEDHMSKPLAGRKLKVFRDSAMNLSRMHHSQISQQECVDVRTCTGSDMHKSAQEARKMTF